MKILIESSKYEVRLPRKLKKNRRKGSQKAILDLIKSIKTYVCTDCQKENYLIDNKQITVGYCTRCNHPLWN